jgi:hypothetical protein
MIVLKDDKVRIKSGETGVVLAWWGSAYGFISFKRESDGCVIPMFETDVVEVIQRDQGKKLGRRWG